MIASVFQTLRPCQKCGVDFYPPKRPDRRVADYCGYDCERKAGVPGPVAFYRKGSTPASLDRVAVFEPRIRIIQRAAAKQRVQKPGRSRDVVRSRFGANLIRLRTDRGFTQTGLARAAGIGVNLINWYENDRVEPSAGKLQRIADTLGVSMGYLWTGVEDRREAAS